MTYGWAIIIILLAIAALWLLGVFNFSTSNDCIVEAPFNCQDIIIGTNKVEILLGASSLGQKQTSNKIESITINGAVCDDKTGNIEIKSKDGTKTQTSEGGTTLIDSSEPSLDASKGAVLVTCTLNTGTFGENKESVGGTIQIKYQKTAGGLPQSLDGNIKGTIKLDDG